MERCASCLTCHFVCGRLTDAKLHQTETPLQWYRQARKKWAACLTSCFVCGRLIEAERRHKETAGGGAELQMTKKHLKVANDAIHEQLKLVVDAFGGLSVCTCAARFECFRVTHPGRKRCETCAHNAAG